VAKRVLHLWLKFRRGNLKALRDENRVVAKTVLALFRGGYPARPDAGKTQFGIGRYQRYGSNESRRAILLGNIGKLRQKQLAVGNIVSPTSPASTENAW
jgi:hypothetical protein